MIVPAGRGGAVAVLPGGHHEVVVRFDASSRVWLFLDDDLVGQASPGRNRSTTTVVRVAPEGEQLRLLSSGAVTVRQIAMTPVLPLLTARGTEILDARGQPVVLRGVNRNSLEVRPDGWYWNGRDARLIRDTGANAVRVPLSQAFWLERSCHHAPGYRDAVDRAVRQVTARGMTVILDLHHSTRGSWCGTPGLHEMADRLSVIFWKEVAARYANLPGVAFDLYNEPHDISARTWRDGGPVDGWRAAGMQELYDAVRGTGARNLIFVSGAGWAADIGVLRDQPLDGYGLVYAVHVYNEGSASLPEWLDRIVLPIAARAPVVVTEFGTRPPYARLNQRVIEWAESHGLSGWLAWLWAAGDGSGWELISSWDTASPSSVGRPVLEALGGHR